MYISLECKVADSSDDYISVKKVQLQVVPLNQGDVSYRAAWGLSLRFVRSFT